METKVMECKFCKAEIAQNLVKDVKFISKYRTLIEKTYECKKCKTLNFENYEEENKNPAIWD